jgi:hypothetical protein
MWIAHQSQNLVEDVTAGIIFLGTPHLTSENDSRWENWRFILKANRKEISKDSLRASDTSSLAETCQRFQDLNLQVPILTVYETLETKIRDSLLYILRGGAGRKTSCTHPASRI